MRKWFQKFSPTNRRIEKEKAAYKLFEDVALADISVIRFFKRDEITTDLICCEVEVGVDNHIQTWFFHEDVEPWKRLMTRLEGLNGFDKNWMSKVMKPPFETCLYVAFDRHR